MGEKNPHIFTRRVTGNFSNKQSRKYKLSNLETAFLSFNVVSRILSPGHSIPSRGPGAGPQLVTVSPVRGSTVPPSVHVETLTQHFSVASEELTL